MLRASHRRGQVKAPDSARRNMIHPAATASRMLILEIPYRRSSKTIGVSANRHPIFLNGTGSPPETRSPGTETNPGRADAIFPLDSSDTTRCYRES